MDDIDDLIDELRDGALPSSTSTQPSLSAGNINEYILTITNDIISNGMVALGAMQNEVLTSRNDTTVEAYSSLLKSLVGAVETISKINLQQMKQQGAREIKEMDIQSRERVASSQAKISSEGHHNTNNILVTTREDFFKMVADIDEKKIIEAEAVDIDGDF